MIPVRYTNIVSKDSFLLSVNNEIYASILFEDAGELWNL
jgi:hypothetical protein